MDPLPFVLAEKLGRTVSELNESLTAEEYVQWAAFFEYREAMREQEQAKIEARAEVERKR